MSDCYTDREPRYRSYRRAMDISADLSGVVESLAYWSSLLDCTNLNIDDGGRLPSGFCPLCLNAADALEDCAKRLRIVARG